TATWLGQSAETWRWETRQAGALIAHERRTRRDGARVAIAEWALERASLTPLQGELEVVLGAVSLAMPDAAATGVTPP
ncbi:MAG: hypothetical protein VKP62_05255, partial [Candidatus Sericytochromatia bacterium]|nr:hypothetical protein [Candidatus Sericytochromatia bacterium]